MYTTTYKRTGQKLYLHRKLSITKKSFVWYFNKEEKDAVDLPADFEVIESPRSGYPLVRKRRKNDGV